MRTLLQTFAPFLVIVAFAAVIAGGLWLLTRKGGK